MKTFFTLLFLHVIFFVLGTVFFALLFHTRLFQSVNVLFYRGILLLIISCIFIIVFMLFYKNSIYGRVFTYRDIFLSIILIFCLNLVFFTLLPVTAERSISIFLLGYMNKNSDKALTDNEITKVFIKEYLYKYRAMDKRFNEQIVSGNIIRNGNAYKISKQGKSLMKIYAFIANVFNIDKKLISP